MQIHKQIEEWYSKWFSGEEELSDEEEEALEELKTIATKSAEVERERILGLASDISDELTNANVPVIHPGELGEHEPDDVWEVSGNQTAHAFYGMLEQKIKGGKNGK